MPHLLATEAPEMQSARHILERFNELSHVLVAAGALGVQLLSTEDRLGCPDLQVAIDLNAVPPVGIQGVELVDKAVKRDGITCYGAIGVGGVKMRIHKAAIAALFESNDKALDAEEVFEIGRGLAADG